MRERYSETTKYILLAIGLTGFVVVAAMAPGIVQLAGLLDRKRLNPYYGPGSGNKKKKKSNTVQAVRRLEKSDMYVIKKKKGKFVVELTEKGKQKLQELKFREMKIVKPARWDKKWRIVIFDIPDRSFRYGRDALRSQLKKWEFYQLQKSVWVCPWPCEKEIRSVAAWHEITSYVNIITAEHIQNDAESRKHFGIA